MSKGKQKLDVLSDSPIGFKQKRRIGTILSKFAIYFALLALMAYFTFMNSAFISLSNIMNIGRQVAVNGIAAAGMTFVMLTGGIDISVGAVIGLSSVGAASLMVAGVHPVLAVLIMVSIGMIIGFINGFFVNEIKIPPMIVTLSTLSIARGMAFIITGGMPVSRFPHSFTVMGQGRVGYVPIPVIIMLVCFAIAWFVLEKTTFGRHVYGIGSNPEASRLSGIAVRKVMFLVYGISGMMASFAGTVLLSRVNSGQPNAGETYELNIIAAIVIGGVSTKGGEGRIINVLVGLVFMGVLLNGMMMMNVPAFYQRVAKGIVLLIAISYDRLSQQRAGRIA